MGQAGAQVAQHRGVGQVALPAGDRQLAGEVLEDGVGDAQVAFGVLEVDGVDLVRHGRGADLAGHGLLLEVAEGDVAPDVPVEVDQDGVEAGDGIEQLGDVVMRLDLGGVGIQSQAEVVFDEGTRIGFPIDVRVGGQVSVVVAHGAVDLAQRADGGDLLDLALQAIDHVGQFLAQTGGGGGLTVGPRQHGHVGEAMGQHADLAGDLAHQWQQHLVTAFAQHQGVGQVVDVLGGAGEVDEFAHRSQFRQVGDLFLEQVLDGLDVVIGGALDVLDALGLLDAELGGQLVQQGIGLGGEGCDLGNARVGGQAL